jgi:hypothetical protein
LRPLSSFPMQIDPYPFSFFAITNLAVESFAVASFAKASFFAETSFAGDPVLPAASTRPAPSGLDFA